jgi:hypothetical protein
VCPLCPSISDINLFRYCQRIIHFDPEISNCAFDLGMSEQKLDGPEIARAPINQGSFCASQGMRPKQPRIKSGTADPVRYKAHIGGWSCWCWDRGDP